MLNYETIMWISGAFLVASLIFLCFYIVAEFYAEFFETIKEYNLQDDILEVIDIVNRRE